MWPLLFVVLICMAGVMQWDKWQIHNFYDNWNLVSMSQLKEVHESTYMRRQLTTTAVTESSTKSSNSVVSTEREVDLEYTTNFNMTDYLLNRLPVAPKPTINSCRLKDGGKDRNVKVLVFVDNCYFALFTNWYKQFLDVCGESRKEVLEVVCMDTEVVLSVFGLGLACSSQSFVMPNFHSYRRKQASVWLKRLEIIIRFLDTGTDLLLTDTDAIWRSDPFPHLQQHIAHSMVIASRGNFPATVSARYGATVCMGFAFFKASMFTLMLMKSVLQEMRYDRPDDQYAINMVLEKWNIQYPQYLDLEYNTVPHTGHIVVASHIHNITLLPHDKFIRNCTRLSKATNLRLTRASINVAQSAVSDAVVAHCVFTAGNAYSKFLSIRAYRLWHVDAPMLMSSSIVPTPGCIVRTSNSTTTNPHFEHTADTVGNFARKRYRRKPPSSSNNNEGGNAGDEEELDENETKKSNNKNNKKRSVYTNKSGNTNKNKSNNNNNNNNKKYVDGGDDNDGGENEEAEEENNDEEVEAMEEEIEEENNNDEEEVIIEENKATTPKTKIPSIGGGFKNIKDRGVLPVKRSQPVKPTNNKNKNSEKK